MKFALHGVGSGSTVKPEPLAQVARKAEQLGFESIWVPEHMAVPVEMRTRYPYAEDGKFPGGPMAALHDPFLALAYVAAVTERIKIGTGVFVLPLRNAIAVARSVASLDVLSNGRFLFGVGVGWLEDEFEAVGMPFKDRAARTREAIRMMKALWSEETPSFEGRFHRFPPLGFNPKPVQKPHPPILIGGDTKAALRRAAQIGDGWYGAHHSVESVRPLLAELKQHCEAAGRDFSRFEITIGLSPGVRPDVDTARRLADVGVHRMIVFAPGFVPRSRFESDLFPTLERFAGEVIDNVGG
jgi:probable F420-dependent oxidoreductase